MKHEQEIESEFKGGAILLPLEDCPPIRHNNKKVEQMVQ